MKTYFKLNRFVLVALFITSINVFQASDNTAQAKAEYRNTRRLFAALGLKHTNHLVIEEREAQLIEASRDESMQEVLTEMEQLTSSGRFTMNQLRLIRQMIKEQPIRKDLRIAFINENIGYGVFATNPMPVNTVIGVYAGKISSPEQTNQDYAFLFAGIAPSDDEIDNNHYVDASIYGNATRFINHSNDHNCSTFNILDHNQIPQLVFVTRDPIARGEQLTINYGEVYNWGREARASEVIILK